MFTNDLDSCQVGSSEASGDRPDHRHDPHAAAGDADNRSSSTEGPDSTPQSTSSSPIHVMIPAYPYGEEGDGAMDEAADGAEALQPILPPFAVKFTEDIAKDGDRVLYHLRVWKLAGSPESADRPQADNGVCVLQREYDDFEQLHYTLITQNKLDGIIVPPLPTRPALDPASAEAESKKQLGSANRQIRGDDFGRDAKALERYLHRLLNHPVFGVDPNLFNFLDLSQPPIRCKIKKGFLAGVKETLDARKVSSLKDPDDFFQKEREWASAYGYQIRDARNRFQCVVHCRLRLCSQLRVLCTTLSTPIGGHQGANGFYNRLNCRFACCLEEALKGEERQIRCEERSMDNYLQVWANYVDSEHQMLQGRSHLVREADKADRALLKAKPSKLASCRLIKEQKQRNLDECSKRATAEIRRFHQHRLSEMKDSLVQYTEAQIQAATQTHLALAQCALALRDLELPTMLMANVEATLRL